MKSCLLLLPPTQLALNYWIMIEPHDRGDGHESLMDTKATCRNKELQCKWQTSEPATTTAHLFWAQLAYAVRQLASAQHNTPYFSSSFNRSGEPCPPLDFLVGGAGGATRLPLAASTTSGIHSGRLWFHSNQVAELPQYLMTKAK